MSLYNYVGAPNTNLICCICRNPFMDPTTTRTCAHTFCQECILRALSHSPLCPVDRSPLVVGDLGPADPIVRSLVDELPVECTHAAEGCAHTAQRQMMPAHLRDECVFGEVPCLEEGCVEVVRRGKVEKHRREVHGREVEEGEVEEVEVEEETEEEKEEETPSSSSQPVPPQDPQIPLLTEQNLLLRHRVAALESAMLTMRREIGTVKAALGPWYHPEGVPAGSGYAGPSLLEIPSEAASSSSSGVDNMAAGYYYVPTRPEDIDRYEGGYPYAYPAAGGGGYFSDGVPPHMRPGPGQHPHLHHHRLSSLPGGSPSSSPSALAIAPLDLSGSLEGTLSGLRGSVAALAAGVDSLGRRNEMALTNEIPRLGEEVMSLRAGLHGLRMQVHGMMLERNVWVTGRGGGAGGGEEGDGGGGGWGMPPPPMMQRMYFASGAPGSITKL